MAARLGITFRRFITSRRPRDSNGEQYPEGREISSMRLPEPVSRSKSTAKRYFKPGGRPLRRDGDRGAAPPRLPRGRGGSRSGSWRSRWPGRGGGCSGGGRCRWPRAPETAISRSAAESLTASTRVPRAFVPEGSYRTSRAEMPHLTSRTKGVPVRRSRDQLIVEVELHGSDFEGWKQLFGMRIDGDFVLVVRSLYAEAQMQPLI
jgi:hypothetical protein